jgi:hypothetical protein
MNLKIGIDNVNDIVLKEIDKIETSKFKIKVIEKKDRFLSEPQILEAFIISLSANVAWDMFKVLFNILNTHNIKMNPANTELNKIGSIYFGDNASDITVIIQNDNSALISSKKNTKKLRINKNFEVTERDEK